MLPWTSVLDATGDFKPSCPQSPFRSALMNEDCLYLNIFTPVISVLPAQNCQMLVVMGSLFTGSRWSLVSSFILGSWWLFD